MPASRIPNVQWDMHKEEIRDLYVNQEKTLEETIDTITRKHGFSPTKSQYVRKLDNWGMRKNINKKQWRRAAELVNIRSSRGKDTRVFIGGQLVPLKRLKKGIGRLGARNRNAEASDGSRDVMALSPTPIMAFVEEPSRHDCEYPVSPWIIIDTLPFFKTHKFIEPLGLRHLGSFQGQFGQLGTLSLTSNASTLDTHLIPIPGASEYTEPLKIPVRLQSTMNTQLELPHSDQIASFQSFLCFIRWAIYMSSNNLMKKSQTDSILDLIDTHEVARGITQGFDINDPSVEIFTSNLLCQAINDERLCTVRALLNAGVSANCQSPNQYGTGCSALFLAATNGKVELVKLLLRHGADPSYSGWPQATVLDSLGKERISLASRNRDAEMDLLKVISLLMKFEAKPSLKFLSAPDIIRSRRFLYIPHNQDPPDLNEILEEESSRSGSAYGLEAGFQYALCNDHEGRVDELLKAGVNPNMLCYLLIGDEFCAVRPIIIAAKRNDLEAAQLLLEHGADPNGTVSPAEEAVFYGASIDTIPAGPSTRPALHYALAKDKMAMRKLLIQHGADYTSLYTVAEVDTLLSRSYSKDLGKKNETRFQVEGIFSHGDPALIDDSESLFKAIKNACDPINNPEGDYTQVESLLCQGANPNTPRISDGVRPLAAALKKERHSYGYNGYPITSLLMKHGADVNAEYFGNRGTIFEQVVAGRNIELIREFLCRGADATLITHFTWRANGDWGENDAGHSNICDIILLLLEHGLDINKTNSLEKAIASRDLALILFLLENGTNPNTAPRSGPPPVHQVVQLRHTIFKIKALEALLAHGADIHSHAAVEIYDEHNEFDKRTPIHLGDLKLEPQLYMTPLQIAVMADETPHIVNRLIQNGADINALPGHPRGFTALQIAIINDNEEMVDLLISMKADIHAPAAFHVGCTALQAAILKYRNDLAETFLDSGADVNAPAPHIQGFTALQACIQADIGDDAMALRLLEAGADVNAEASSDSGRTALQGAVLSDASELVKTLLDHGADVNAPAALKGGATALQFAAIQGDLDVVVLLLEHRADINAKPSMVDGRTAIQGAAEHGRFDIVNLLLENQPCIDYEDCERAAILADEEGHSVVAREIRHWIDKARRSSNFDSNFSSTSPRN